jgi:hypothetical protein
MGREGCSPDDALALLEARAETAEQTVPDVAAAVLAEHARSTAAAALRAGLRRG